MKKVLLALSLVGLGFVLGVNGAFAATDNHALTINANMAARAKLTVGVGAINFQDSDPGAVLSIPATENAVTVNVKVRTGSTSISTLTHLTNGDLTATGGNTIPISNVTWTATGPGFAAGTMNKSTAQSAGSWTGSGEYTGTFNYFLVNSWSYATGDYTVSSTYTLTAP